MKEGTGQWATALFVVGLLHGGRAADAEIRMLSVRLDGECAQSGSASLGWGEFALDTETGELSYTVAHDDVGAGELGAHIHGPIEQACGFVGNGDIVVFFPFGSPKIGSVTLTPQQQQGFLQGLYYVNIHSNEHGFGEIAGVIQNMQKNRGVSVIVPPPAATAGGAVSRAVRVHLRDLYADVTVDPVAGCPQRFGLPDISVFEGDTSYRWFGPPIVVSDGTAPPNADYLVAPLQCCPHFRDWSPAGLAAEFGGDMDVGVIHAVGPAVVPCSSYAVQFVDSSCADLDDEQCYTYPTFVRTAKWGDIVPSFNWEGEPNFLDIGAIVNCYKSIPMPGGQNKLRCQIKGNELPLGEPVNFIHINAAVQAYKGFPYPDPGPAPCGPCP
jgi:hypothetical protein